MCGIFGVVSSEGTSVEQVLSGLSFLEYRGYDSAGLAFLNKQNLLQVYKSLGEMAHLKNHLAPVTPKACVSMGHTRWSTHGAPSYENAHPLINSSKSRALVHNGIIENSLALKQSLTYLNYPYQSETDSEIIFPLLEETKAPNLKEAIQIAVGKLEGHFAIVIMDQAYPDALLATAHGVPLILAFAKGCAWITSDLNAIHFPDIEHYYFLENKEYALITATGWTTWNKEGQIVTPPKSSLSFQHVEPPSIEHYPHFMLKEISDEPKSLETLFLKERSVGFFKNTPLRSVPHILILGAGSSWHAGLVGKHLIEKKLQIPVTVQISSEYEAIKGLYPENSIVLAISQSGETQDTYQALCQAKKLGFYTIAITNSSHSIIARRADEFVNIHAGSEISVCSTKTFLNSIAMLYILCMHLQIRHQKTDQALVLQEALHQVPGHLNAILGKEQEISALARKYYNHEPLLFLGKGCLHFLGMEAALKCKEVGYMHAEAYPMNELKHGPLALVDENSLAIAFCNKEKHIPAYTNILHSIHARGGKMLCFTSLQQQNAFSDPLPVEYIHMPYVSEEIAPFLYATVTQLLAYYIARRKGHRIDHPRNLAKTITVG